MPNLERLTGCLWAAWDADNLVITAADPAHVDDPSYTVTVQQADLPDLLAFIQRRHPAWWWENSPPPPLAPRPPGPPPAPEVEPPAPAPASTTANEYAERTAKAIEVMHDHPGPFQTEAALRALHAHVTNLELRVPPAKRHRELADAIATIDQRMSSLEQRKVVTIEDLNLALHAPAADGSPPLGDVLDQRLNALEGKLSALEGALEGENGITASVAAALVTVEAVQEHVSALQQRIVDGIPAGTIRDWIRQEINAREVVTSEWVKSEITAAIRRHTEWTKDEIGAALRLHAGALHELIAREVRNLFAYVQAAVQPRPGLLRRLATALVANHGHGAVQPPAREDLQRPTVQRRAEVTDS